MDDNFQTLVELLEQSAQRWPELPAAVMHGNESWSWTYHELLHASRQTASYLSKARG